jgi:hypothetical protein
MGDIRWFGVLIELVTETMCGTAASEALFAHVIVCARTALVANADDERVAIVTNRGMNSTVIGATLCGRRPSFHSVDSGI